MLFCAVHILESEVSLSISLLPRKSSKRSNLNKKSAPMMALSTDAMTKGYVNCLRRPRSTVKDLDPYVYIFAPFAAERISSVLSLWSRKKCFGKTEMSAPESNRKLILFLLSTINNRREIPLISGSVAVDGTGSIGFLEYLMNYLLEICMALYILELCRRIYDDTNRFHTLTNFGLDDYLIDVVNVYDF